MHPHEFKRIKANTGRLTHLCLADSELHIGESFDQHEAVQALINDPKNYPVLLYPGKEALDLSKAGAGERGAKSEELGAGTMDYLASGSGLHALRSQLKHRRLVVFLLDATWRLARPMLRLSITLQRLPQIMFSGAAPSRYLIKKQPEPGCLSTLEATHELLLALDRTGLDHYVLPNQMIDLFMRMQEIQITRTAENRRLGISRHVRKPKQTTPVVKKPRSPRRRKIFPKAALPPSDNGQSSPAG